MRILIIDDAPANLKSAELTLPGHQLTLVNSYDEARELLKPKELESPPNFEIILCGLVPSVSGLDLAFDAVLHGVTHIGVLSDDDSPNNRKIRTVFNHITEVSLSLERPMRFVLKGVTVQFFPTCYQRCLVREGVVCHKCNGKRSGTRIMPRFNSCDTCNANGGVFGRHWGDALKRLLAVG